MTKTLTVAGDVNAIDTRVNLTGQGSVTSPSLVVPSGMTKIKKIMFAASHDGAADNGSALWLLRLGGNAVLNGEQTIVMAGAGNQSVQSGSDAAPNVMNSFVLDNVDLDVSPSDTINIAAEFAGVDIGDTAVIVTIVYGK